MNWLDNLPANFEHHNENPAWNPLNAPVHVPEPWRRKRFRTIFTPYQLAWLEREFRLRPYRIRRSQLAEQLKLTERQIKVWFQNRRTKLKKENLENIQPTPAEQIMETPTNMAQENRTILCSITSIMTVISIFHHKIHSQPNRQVVCMLIHGIYHFGRKYWSL